MEIEQQIKKIKVIRNIIIFVIIIIEIVLATYLIITWPKRCSGNTTFKSQENDIYNAKIEKYTGTGKSGSITKEAIETIISNNEEHAEQPGKFISLYANDIEEHDREEELTTVNQNANIYENTEGENTIKNIRKATAEYKKLKEKISDNKKYNIQADYEEGIIYRVTIEER